jgi:hypothetical protein
VHNAVLNIATSYLIASTAPAIGVHSPAQIVDPASKGPDPEAANATDVIAYPTLEGLFGEMDYCECEHCRSILSPAAYLVNLLQFIDLKQLDESGDEILPRTYTQENPQDVLFRRRPDIQHLPLTCENTNTPLPYIDVVNETLEYFVTNNLKLDNYTGHSTDEDAMPEELLASPQFVTDKAYDTLAGKPLNPGDPPPLLPPTGPLPFHRPLENLRRYFDGFETPLPEVMEALRKDDSLERPDPADPTHPGEYGWRDILMEELRLSRAEYTLLTNSTITLGQLYGYPSTTPEPDVLAGLSNAKAFTRRVGISYEDIFEILKTRFVNPHSALIPKLERLGVSFATLKTLNESPLTGQDWLDLLPKPLPEASRYGGNIETWVKNDENYKDIIGLLTVTNPIPGLIRKLEEVGIPFATLKSLKEAKISDAEFDALLPPDLDVSRYGGDVKKWVKENLDDAGDDCSFDKLEFRYADPAKTNEPVRAFEFVRLIRFIRLWKKLGWTIEQTDKAITALYPADQAPEDPDDAENLQRLDNGFLALLPRLGVVGRVMDALQLKPEKDLLALLACFAPIDTHGAASLYRQMFLSTTLLKQDGAFADDGFGNFLADTGPRLVAHAEALRAAFSLTDDELSQISAALGFGAETTLSLDNISAVFRRGWLARKLRLSVREFVLLTRFTGLDPFLDPFVAPDPPNPTILRLIKLVDHLRTAELKPAEALYLVWNQDVSGKSVPDEKETLEFVRSLRGDFATIESEFTLVDDPDGQIARSKMSLVYGSEATDTFFGLLDNKVVTDVPYSQPQLTLKQTILDAAPELIAYDNLRKRLSFNGGVMPDATRDALKDASGATQIFRTAVDELYENSRAFFDRYPDPELLRLHDAFIASNDKVVPYSQEQATLNKTLSENRQIEQDVGAG